MVYLLAKFHENSLIAFSVIMQTDKRQLKQYLPLAVAEVITACTAIQAVVKANSQSNRKGQILTPGVPKPLDGFR